MQTTKILKIDSNESGKIEEIISARGGESVGIWIDLFKGKVKEGMGVFKENDGFTSSEEMIEPSDDELITFLNKTVEDSLNARASELNSHIAKYLVFLNNKEKDLVYMDDYGDFCFDLWWDECERFIDKKLLILKLEIIEEGRLLLKEKYEHRISNEIMEIFDEYLCSYVIRRITNNIDELLKDYDG